MRMCSFYNHKKHNYVFLKGKVACSISLTFWNQHQRRQLMRSSQKPLFMTLSGGHQTDGICIYTISKATEMLWLFTFKCEQNSTNTDRNCPIIIGSLLKTMKTFPDPCGLSRGEAGHHVASWKDQPILWCPASLILSCTGLWLPFPGAQSPILYPLLQLFCGCSRSSLFTLLTSPSHFGALAAPSPLPRAMACALTAQRKWFSLKVTNGLQVSKCNLYFLVFKL